MSRLILVLTLCLPSVVFARGGTGAANAEYKNPKSLKGLCNDDSKDEDYYKQGYCLSLGEQFKKNDCTKQALAELRARINRDPKDPVFNKLKGKDKDGIDGMFSCNGKGEKQDMSEIAKDQDKFNYLMMQWIAMLTVQTSNWNVLNNEQSGTKGPDGLLDLSLEKGGVKDMENKDYACGCKEQVATTSGQSGVTNEGQSPGPLDGHHSLTCGSYMILKNILKDGDMGAGKDKSAKASDKSPKDSRIGAAKIVAALETKADQDDLDRQQIWRSDKMETFCKKYWSSSESKTNHWDDDIGTNSSK